MPHLHILLEQDLINTMPIANYEMMWNVNLAVRFLCSVFTLQSLELH